MYLRWPQKVRANVVVWDKLGLLSADKAENDRQRLMKDYQKEVKQLYKDLNERSQTVEDLKNELETEKTVGFSSN